MATAGNGDEGDKETGDITGLFILYYISQGPFLLIKLCNVLVFA